MRHHGELGEGVCGYSLHSLHWFQEPLNKLHLRITAEVADGELGFDGLVGLAAVHSTQFVALVAAVHAALCANLFPKPER